MSRPDHERIWLQNAEDAKNQCEGRLWCEDKIWPDDPEDGEPTEYTRADIYEAAEARIAVLEKALDGLLKPFEGDDCRYDHHGHCQAHFLQEVDECCVKIARRVREGGKVDG